jgi:hypothetical protein
LISSRPDVKLGAIRKSKQNMLGNLTMNGEPVKEEWMKLCEQAAGEQDPEKLMDLTREICRLLDEKEKELKQRRS